VSPGCCSSTGSSEGSATGRSSPVRTCRWRSGPQASHSRRPGPALAAALLAGLGFGGIGYGLIQLFAVGFGRRSTALLNILNAHFGAGAILGPMLIGAVGSAHYPEVFLGFAAAGLPLLLCLKGVRDRAPEPSSSAHTPRPRSAGSW